MLHKKFVVRISLLYINITEECTHALPVSVRWSSKLPEINKLYYKYKSNIETILLHPEISSPIALFKQNFCKQTLLNDIVVNSFLAWLITESITMYSVHLSLQCNKVYIPPYKKIRIIRLILDFKLGNGRQSKRQYRNDIIASRNFQSYSGCSNKSFVSGVDVWKKISYSCCY
jgi:hypothetical protein